jgi:hypothetical protein
VAKVSDRKPTDFSMPWMEARTKSSSSTTNTVGAAGGVIYAASRFGEQCESNAVGKKVNDSSPFMRDHSRTSSSSSMF